MCEDNGGSLASIRSSEENSWIVDTFLPPWNSGYIFLKTLLFRKKVVQYLLLKVSRGFELRRCGSAAQCLIRLNYDNISTILSIKSISQNILIAILLSRFMETLYFIGLIVKIYYACAVLTCRFLIRLTIYYKLHISFSMFHFELYISMFWYINVRYVIFLNLILS